MRDFEKKLALRLKAEAERIVPESRDFDMGLQEGPDSPDGTDQSLNSGGKKRRLISPRRLVAVAAAVLLLFSSVLIMDYLSGSKGSNYSFQIISFAGNDGMDGNQLEERLLEANLSMVMPNGQIMLDPGGGKLRPDRPEEWTYGWGTASFYVAGEDIARVTYSLKNGMISHFDHAMELKLNTEGNPRRIEFFLPYSALNLDETKIDQFELEGKYIERIKELWNSGECPELEAAKKGYFGGKSLNIEDYTLMSFVGTWKAAQTGGRYFRFIDKALDERLSKEAHQVTVEYYHFDYGEAFNFSDSIYSVTWSPGFKSSSIIGVTNPEDLPGDEMTVTVELKNGEVIKKVISLTFDKEGYAVARIKR